MIEANKLPYRNPQYGVESTSIFSETDTVCSPPMTVTVPGAVPHGDVSCYCTNSCQEDISPLMIAIELGLPGAVTE